MCRDRIKTLKKLTRMLLHLVISPFSFFLKFDNFRRNASESKLDRKFGRKRRKEVIDDEDGSRFATRSCVISKSLQFLRNSILFKGKKNKNLYFSAKWCAFYFISLFILRNVYDKLQFSAKIITEVINW